MRGEALKCCIREIMEGETGKVLKIDAIKWKTLASEAVGKDGSSHKNIIEFLKSLQLLDQPNNIRSLK